MRLVASRFARPLARRTGRRGLFVENSGHIEVLRASIRVLARSDIRTEPILIFFIFQWICGNKPYADYTLKTSQSHTRIAACYVLSGVAFALPREFPAIRN